MARNERAVRKFPRTARVNELVHETVAEELERMSDPRLDLVTVTGVDVTADLRHATVYYAVTTRAKEDAAGRHEEASAALASAASHLRGVLGRQVRLKYLPALTFKEDPSIEAGRRVEAIIREIHRPDRPGARPTDDEGSVGPTQEGV